jgi:hypothetical protein
MPLKHNITKFDVLAQNIHHIAIRMGASDLTNKDKRTKLMGILIASLSSSQSWQTHNILKENPSNLNRSEVKDEYVQANASRWKTVSAADINEVLNLGVSDNAFSRWLFFAVDSTNHDLYKSVWEEMKKDFTQPCDEVEMVDKKIGTKL